MNVYSRKVDARISLTRKGWQQALDCGDFLNEFYDKYPPKGEVEAWLSSYQRTRETMAGIFERAGNRINRIHETDAFTAIRFGVLEGLSREQRREKFPDQIQREIFYERERAAYFFQDLGGESRADVSRRCRDIFGAINHSYKDNGVSDFWIVCHSITERCIANVWLGRRFEDIDEAGKPTNCSVRLIDTQRDFGYIFQNGQPQELQEINCKRAQDYYLEGAYRPPFADELSKPFEVVQPK